MSNSSAKDAKTLLSTYFLKIKLTNVNIQRKVTRIFLPALTEIMKDSSQEWRINVLKHFLMLVKMCVVVYQQDSQFLSKRVKEKIVDDLCNKIFGTTSKLIIALLQNKIPRSSKVVDRILHTVFIDDLSCDIGDKLVKYRKAPSSEKEKLKLEIEALLVDYNDINNTNLTFDDIINRGVKDENRRGDRSSNDCGM